MVKNFLNDMLRQEILERVHQFHANLLPAWGKMNAYQTIKHCRLFEAWVHGIGDWDYSISRSTPDQAKYALKYVTADDSPIQKHAASTLVLIVEEEAGDFVMEKSLWISHLEAYKDYCNPKFVHDFFGKMTEEQIGILAYKHTDHHLRQFGL